VTGTRLLLFDYLQHLCPALCVFIHTSVIVCGICQLFRSVWRERATRSMNRRCGFAALREASFSWENTYQRFGGTLRCTRSTKTSTYVPDHMVSYPRRRQTSWRFGNVISDLELIICLKAYWWLYVPPALTFYTMHSAHRTYLCSVGLLTKSDSFWNIINRVVCNETQCVWDSNLFYVPGTLDESGVECLRP
jgi:hypothetical protein